MNNTINKLKVIVKKVKHTFSPAEVAELNVDFGQAFDNVQAVNKDADAQKRCSSPRSPKPSRA